MCTVTLRRDERGLLLTMNRDELRARGPELPPEIMEIEGATTRWLGPRDAARGGTWIGVNEHGLVACLMNGNVPFEDSIRAIEAGAPSRGDIVPGALANKSAHNAVAWLRDRFDYTPYPAFMLLLADTRDARLVTWWGQGQLEEKTLENPWAMASSSQWETEKVLAYRNEAFLEWLAAGAALDEELPTIHRHRETGKEAFGIWVERGYACTRSITQIKIAPGAFTITMRYAQADHTIGPFQPYDLPAR